MPFTLFSFRQGDAEIANAYCSPGYLHVTAGPAIAVPNAVVKVYNSGSALTGAWEANDPDFESLSRLRKLALSKAAARVIRTLLEGRIEGLAKATTFNRERPGLWCTRCRVAFKAANAASHRHRKGPTR